MYSLINSKIDWIIQEAEKIREIKVSEHVKNYDLLRADLTNVDKEGSKYQRDYRKFWAMNVARLPDSFYDKYFRLLEQHKTNSAITVREICDELSKLNGTKHPGQLVAITEISTKDKGTLQFSFSSKLVHMVNPDKPIFDKNVKEFFFMPDPQKPGKVERLDEYMNKYDFLETEYKRILDDGILAPSIKRFREVPKTERFSDVKCSSRELR